MNPVSLDLSLAGAAQYAANSLRVRRLLHTDFPAVLRIERDLGHEQIDAQTLDHWLDQRQFQAWVATVDDVLVAWLRLGLSAQCVLILAVTVAPALAAQNAVAKRLVQHVQSLFRTGPDPRPLVRIVPERDLGQLLDFRALGFRGELVRGRDGGDWIRMVYRGGR